MTLVREFNLYLTAGKSIPLVINVNQFDSGEQWAFTIYKEDGTQYIPSTGAIVGIKSDNLGIINSGTVDENGRVIITETQQMTASVGKAVFELTLDSGTHGTANFVVLVEEKPGNNADLSDSDISLIQEALNAVSPLPTGGTVGQVLTKTAQGSTWSDAGTPTQEQVAEAVSDWADEHITVETGVVIDTSLSVAGAAADAKKTGDEISDLKSAIDTFPINDHRNMLDVGATDFSMLYDEKVVTEWEQGHIKSADGTNGSPPAALYSLCIRTKDFIDVDRYQLIITSKTSTLQLNVFEYNADGTYVDVTAYTHTNGIFYVNFTEGKKYRIVIREPNTSNTLDLTALDGFHFYNTANTKIFTQSLFKAVSEMEAVADWHEGQYITFTDDHANVETPSTSQTDTAWRYALIPCSQGDIFTLTVSGLSGGRAYYITDANYDILVKADANANLVSEEIVIPTGSAYLIVNDYSHGGVFKGKPLSDASKFYKDIAKTGYLKNTNSVALWEQGHIKSSDGTDGTSPAPMYDLRIRTIGYVSENVVGISITDQTYGHVVIKYKADGTFVGTEDVNGSCADYLFDHLHYKYRIMLRTKSSTAISPSAASSVIFYSYPIKPVNSYSRAVNFGNVNMLSQYYAPNGTYTEDFGATTMSSVIYDLFDQLVASKPNYITKQDLGVAYDSVHLYSYAFKPVYPKYPNMFPKNKLPKVIIISGQHGTEKASVYGLYYMMRDITERFDSSPILGYLRSNVEFVIVPIVNRYGFDNRTYKNENGVNINRNYDINFVVGDDPEASSYGGPYALSETESQMMVNLVNANDDAFFVVDWHTNGSASVLADLNWHSYTENIATDPYLCKLIDCSCSLFSMMTPYLNKRFGFNFGTGLCGFFNTAADGQPTFKEWCNSIGCMSMTFETTNLVPPGAEYQDNIQRLNSEFMVNWLAVVFSNFGK